MFPAIIYNSSYQLYFIYKRRRTWYEEKDDAIINVTGGSNLTLFEVEEAAEVIRSSANTDINTIFGAVINENLNDEVIVTVIATGFDDPSEPLYHSYNRTNSMDESHSQMMDDDDDDDDDSGIPTFLRKRGGF